MEVSEIKQIADKLVLTSNSESAFFDILTYGGADEFFIRANRDGLKLYAAELLYASVVDNESKTWGIDPTELPWLNSETMLIDFIKLTNEPGNEDIIIGKKLTLTQRFGELGCFVGVVILVACFVVGAVSLVKMIAGWF